MSNAPKKSTWDVPDTPRLSPMRELDAIRPETEAQVRQALMESPEGAALVPVGSGRHMRGLPAPDSTILDMRGLSKVTGWDAESGVVTVQSGVTVGQLRGYLAERGGSLCGWRVEDPAATVGGLLSSHQPVGHALWNGSVREACISLSALTGAGDRYRYLPAPRKSAGPDLRHLFIGAEGRFGVITTAVLGVTDKPVLRRRAQITGVLPPEALRLLADAFAAGLRAPNVIYSGAERQIEVWLEGAKDTVQAMEAALSMEVQARGLQWELDALEEGAEAGWSAIRAGADPLSGREADPQGGVSLWGNPRDLVNLPEAIWSEAVVYDVSLHQVSVNLPRSSAAAKAIEGLGEARSFWWGSDGVQRPATGGVGVDLAAIKRALDPRGILPALPSATEGT